MRNSTKKIYFATLSAIFLAITFGVFQTEACTRFVYKGNDNQIITARTMDWSDDFKTDLWIFPKGIKRSGNAGKKSVEWTSLYGSVIASVYDLGTAGGMNEAGLSADLLWLDETKFPPVNDEKPGLSVSVWVQYILDNFATVQEAVDAFRNSDIQVSTSILPGASFPVLVHVAISDATGDNAVLEYINEKLVIHHNPSYVVLTNDPKYEQQLTINNYWKNIKGKGSMLPGSGNSSDRFVRASYYVDQIQKDVDTQIAIAGVFSLIRNLSVPYYLNKNGSGRSSTQWRTVADQKNKVFYYESALWYSTAWLQLDKINFAAGQSIKRLNIDNSKTFSGDITGLASPSNPFEFYPALM